MRIMDPRPRQRRRRPLRLNHLRTGETIALPSRSLLAGPCGVESVKKCVLMVHRTVALRRVLLMAPSHPVRDRFRTNPEILPRSISAKRVYQKLRVCQLLAGPTPTGSGKVSNPHQTVVRPHGAAPKDPDNVRVMTAQRHRTRGNR